MLLDRPIKVGRTELGGRIVFPPMATEGSDNGEVTPALVRHYQAIAANPNVSLIITEHAYIHPSGKASPGQLSVARDEDVPGLRRLVQAIHETRPGIKVFAQISHAGLNTRSAWTGGMLLAPTGDGLESHTLSVAEIKQVEQWFSEAAGRVKEAGFDGVELHSAHGYLLNEFLSPLTNGRTDEYGPQSIENRSRIHTETLAAARAMVGPDYPVAVRLGASDYYRGGTTVEEGAVAARLLEQAGADLIDVSGGMNGPQRRGHREPGYFSDASSAVRQAVSVPVLVTGGVTSRRQAEKLLDRGAADLVGVGRALYQDPRWEA